MVDNLTPPFTGTGQAGLPVATDDCAGIHYQKMKLYDGTDAATTAVALGCGVEANALRVAQITVPTATVTSLASSTTSAQLLASTAGRRGLFLTNTDANTVYVKYGTTASATSFTVAIPAGGYWEMPAPIYSGRIDAIWAADGSGSLIATEMT